MILLGALAQVMRTNVAASAAHARIVSEQRPDELRRKSRASPFVRPRVR